MRRLFLFIALSYCSFTHAQLEEVVVSGSRISSSHYGLPVATISKKADFMTKSIELVNDSRSPERRPDELIKTIQNMMASARKNKAIELSYGGDFLSPVVIDEDILKTIDDNEDDEISSISIVVKVAMDKSRSTKDQISELNTFIANAKREGRTEIEAYDDVGLSIVNPQQHRDELLRKIARENEHMKELMGSQCSIKIGGLENRLRWARGSIDELVLYISYSTEVEC